MKDGARDRELIDEYRRCGDAVVLEELVGRHGKALLGYIMNMTGNMDEARDLFQETWLRAIRKMSGYRHDNFRGWLMRIAHNVLIDRRRGSRSVLSLDWTDADGTGPDWHETLASPEPTPAERAFAGEFDLRLSQALGELSVEQREVFLMRTQAGVSFKEIARLQGVSINTALGRMHYAIGKLRVILADFATVSGAVGA